MTKIPLMTTKMWLTTNIYIVGKKSGGEEWISQGCLEYEKRLAPVMDVHTHFLKSDGELIKAARQAKGVIYAMDENGKSVTSLNFSTMLFDGFEEGGSNVSFFIGGYDGLPDDIKKSYKLISLSKMTWAHQMARLLLLEQIYRAAEIRKGSSYHKE
jgi:23S rRNA (pseudouridine1915-N3)-methyltransferase